jgi:hypothetical protein
MNILFFLKFVFHSCHTKNTRFFHFQQPNKMSSPPPFVQIPEHLSTFLDTLHVQYQQSTHAELECRLGIYDRNKKYFSSSVSESYFDTLLKLASLHPKTNIIEYEWTTRTIVYYTDGTRYCYEEEKLEQIKTVHQYNLASQTKGLYDLRYNLKEEIPITDFDLKNQPRIVDSLRTKKTKPFEIIKTGCRMDFSIVQLYTNDLREGCISETHEIELEDVKRKTKKFDVNNFFLETICLLGKGFDQNIVDSLYVL